MAVAGILAVLLSTIIYSYTALKVKQHNNGLPAMTINTGGLLVAVPLYSLLWVLIDGQRLFAASAAGLEILSPSPFDYTRGNGLPWTACGERSTG